MAPSDDPARPRAREVDLRAPPGLVRPRFLAAIRLLVAGWWWGSVRLDTLDPAEYDTSPEKPLGGMAAADSAQRLWAWTAMIAVGFVGIDVDSHDLELVVDAPAAVLDEKASAHGQHRVGVLP